MSKKVRRVEFEGVSIIEQNQSKNTVYAALARAGYGIKWMTVGKKFMGMIFGDRIWLTSQAAEAMTGIKANDLLKDTVEYEGQLKKAEAKYWKRYIKGEKGALVAIKFVENGQWLFNVDFIMNKANETPIEKEASKDNEEIEL